MPSLSSMDMQLWQAWKLATETVRARVAKDIADATGLSDPDFGVLTRVAEDGGGRLRQSQLAASMGWHRSRLSHHLTRMADRGLITRQEAGDGVEVVITESGRKLTAQARPVHAAAVRRHLLDPILPAQREQFLQLLTRLTPSSAADPAATAWPH